MCVTANQTNYKSVINTRTSQLAGVFDVSFAAACVSMLTLSSTMLTTFDDGSMTAAARQWMLAGIGVAVAAVILAMAIYMIREANKKIKAMPKKEQVNGRKEGI